MLKNTIVINEETPIAMCTVGQFMGYLRSQGVMVAVPPVGGALNGGGTGASAAASETVKALGDPGNEGGRKIFGLEGIMKEFKCSKTTAQKYKKGIFKSIIVQQERKIVLDADKAWELYRIQKKKKKNLKADEKN